MGVTKPDVSAGAIRLELVELCEAQQFSSAHLRLLDSGFDAESHPGLWEYLERRAARAGELSLSHRLRQALLRAGVRSPDIALREARHALKDNQPERARAYIEDQFGDLPSSPEARILLGVALAAKDRAAALACLDGVESTDPDTVLLAVDTLRGIGELALARARCEAAQARFRDDRRFANRLTWIAEGMGDLATASAVVQAQLGGDAATRGQGLTRLVRLHRRLGDEAGAMAHAATLLKTETNPLQKMRLAVLLGQSRLLEQLVSNLPADPGLTVRDAEEIAALLMDEGRVGLVLWLWREGIPIGAAAKNLLSRNGFGPGAARAMPGGMEEALSICSPEILFPIRAGSDTEALPPGWPPRLRPEDPILLVNSTLAAGGAERQFVMLARALCENGVAPDRLHAALMSIERDRRHAHFEDDLKALGIHVHDLSRMTVDPLLLPDAQRNRIAMLPTPLRGDVLALWQLAQRLGPAVLHGWQDRSAMAAGIVGQMLAIPRIVLSARNMRPEKRGDSSTRVSRAVYRELIKSPTVRMTANATAGARDYEDWLGLPTGKVEVLANAVDEHRFSPAPARAREDGPIRLVGLFRIVPNKRPLLWLETVAALRQRHGIALAPRIVGTGPLIDEVNRQALRLGLEDLRIDAPQTDPSGIYRDSDAMLLMSSVEGTPNVVLEAQACGLPVAACDVGGVRDALHRRGPDAGLLMRADIRAEDAADALAAWLPGAISAPREGRVAFIRERYSMTALAQLALDLYGGTS